MTESPNDPMADLFKPAAKTPAFNVLRMIAKGGMGCIYLAQDLDRDEQVVVKTLLPGLEERHDIYLRFMREAKLAARLEHPYIVSVYYYGEDKDGLPYMVMPYVQGQTLERIIDSLREKDPVTLERFPLGALVDVFLQVAEAVQFAHDQQVIHRDLKPENIMVQIRWDRATDGLGTG